MSSRESVIEEVEQENTPGFAAHCNSPAPEQVCPARLSSEASYFSIRELADRWRCSRGTVYNRLRFAGARVLDFSTAGRKSKKLVPARTVFQLEAKFTKALP